MFVDFADAGLRDGLRACVQIRGAGRLTGTFRTEVMELAKWRIRAAEKNKIGC